MQLQQPALVDPQVWQIEKKVNSSNRRFLAYTDTACLSSADNCKRKLGSADHSFPGPTLQPGQPEWKLRKLERCRTILVKGRRHILSVLKPVEERVKLELVEQPIKLERKVQSVKEPASWGLLKDWEAAHVQHHLVGRSIKTKNPKPQQSALHLERRWLERPKKMFLRPCKRGGKGQSSRERGMNRAAMNERNMRERFWRLRERSFVIRLHNLLPHNKKTEKVVSGLTMPFGISGHSGMFEGCLERCTPVQSSASEPGTKGNSLCNFS